jgi:hypothetical protein
MKFFSVRKTSLISIDSASWGAVIHNLMTYSGDWVALDEPSILLPWEVEHFLASLDGMERNCDTVSSILKETWKESRPSSFDLPDKTSTFPFRACVSFFFFCLLDFARLHF